MLKCLIFDMDDTLYPEREYYRSGFSAVSRFMQEFYGMDATAAFDVMWNSFSEGVRKDIFNSAFIAAGIEPDKQMVSRVLDVFRNHRPDISLPEDTRAVLDVLGGDFRLAMLSNGYLPAQQYKLDALGIEERFAQVLFTEELGREFWKPSAKGFEVLLERLNHTPDECVYIADNAAWDFAGPKSLGMPTIHVCSPERTQDNRPPDESYAPDYRINSLLELPELLIKMRCRCGGCNGGKCQ
ncbi:Pyrimidine 5'-nucleotidase YjjG [Limihaloglobus sulfuriphilus]|uniref:Pyrimidine 5'-nucleotidase YjjG n=1 Tax=Limihaloglobus sulfuriphilus TaxID=1851148 RepID=A0A1Q2MFN1_9BACT|nr:HAD family hydrolase [Limihaloglobus sulfuriphilus]AQQ71358.1 Pyrimidine 5'-nucleotidase YjjG [Limihaloglobus sulfuriphilus]